MEKQINTSEIIQRKNDVSFVEKFKSEIRTSNLKKLNTIKKKLDFLCLNIDPFQMQDQQDEVNNLLEEFSIKEVLKDPFQITNTLLQLLDLTEDELKKRIH